VSSSPSPARTRTGERVDMAPVRGPKPCSHSHTQPIKPHAIRVRPARLGCAAAVRPVPGIQPGVAVMSPLRLGRLRGSGHGFLPLSDRSFPTWWTKLKLGMVLPDPPPSAEVRSTVRKAWRLSRCRSASTYKVGQSWPRASRCCSLVASPQNPEVCRGRRTHRSSQPSQNTTRRASSGNKAGRKGVKESRRAGPCTQKPTAS
jgi:hypothetical protein